jgi:FkbM family methyltransferase
LINYGTTISGKQESDTLALKRVDYPLTENSLVVDIGGLTGDWASRIYCRHSCYIDVYEPHHQLAKQARENFKNNHKVNVFNYGLASKNGTMILYGADNESSLYPTQNTVTQQTVVIRRASEIFNEKYSRKNIDLLKLNVEGAEYEILPDLIQNFDMCRIRNVQVQFHQVVWDYERQREVIRDDFVRLGFVQTWNDEWVFENWERV